eukprot:GFYU01001221.1.p1 GENE.GFYU01001221.1~~GFYU01001221.1.p1  ORF type:complete len:167 (-),score=37.39 GFYU01001221.1:208-708(-)
MSALDLDAAAAPAAEDPKKLALRQKIMDAFEPFDQDSRKCCDVREVGTIIRSLNIYPSESQLREFITEIEEEEPTGYIRYEKFEMLLMRLLSEGDHQRDHSEKIVKAFKALDTDKKGYLTTEEVTEYMTTHGERFSAEEIDEMVQAAADPETGFIFYEEYAEVLAE